MLIGNQWHHPPGVQVSPDNQLGHIEPTSAHGCTPMHSPARCKAGACQLMSLLPPSHPPADAAAAAAAAVGPGGLGRLGQALRVHELNLWLNLGRAGAPDTNLVMIRTDHVTYDVVRAPTGLDHGKGPGAE